MTCHLYKSNGTWRWMLVTDKQQVLAEGPETPENRWHNDARKQFEYMADMLCMSQPQRTIKFVVNPS